MAAPQPGGLDPARVAPRGRAAPSAGDGRRLITLTFDDGPFPETTPVFLKVLARHDVKAAFFWIGNYLDGDSDRAKKTREVAQLVVAEGHLVGNHTHDHERLTILPRADVLQQIDEGSLSIERAIGKRPTLFRPPYGQLDAWSSERLRERGAELVLWSVEANDMKIEDGQTICDSVREQLEFAGGGVVLLHDIRWGSADALEKLLSWVDHHKWDPNRPDVVGYEVVDLVQYLRATAESPQPFADRGRLQQARSAQWRKEHPQRAPPPPAALATDGAEGS